MHCGTGITTYMIDIEKKEMAYLSKDIDIDELLQEQKDKLKTVKKQYIQARTELVAKLNVGKTTYKTINKKCISLKSNVDKQKRIISKLNIKKKKYLKISIQ
eukprot:56069_1